MFFTCSDLRNSQKNLLIFIPDYLPLESLIAPEKKKKK